MPSRTAGPSTAKPADRASHAAARADAMPNTPFTSAARIVSNIPVDRASREPDRSTEPPRGERQSASGVADAPSAPGSADALRRRALEHCENSAGPPVRCGRARPRPTPTFSTSHRPSRDPYPSGVTTCRPRSGRRVQFVPHPSHLRQGSSIFPYGHARCRRPDSAGQRIRSCGPPIPIDPHAAPTLRVPCESTAGASGGAQGPLRVTIPTARHRPARSRTPVLTVRSSKISERSGWLTPRILAHPVDLATRASSDVGGVTTPSRNTAQLASPSIRPRSRGPAGSRLSLASVVSDAPCGVSKVTCACSLSRWIRPRFRGDSWGRSLCSPAGTVSAFGGRDRRHIGHH